MGAASCSPERPATAWVGQSCRGCGWGQVLDPVHDARGQADTRITAGTTSGKAETPAKASSSVSLGLEKERRAQRGHGLCSKALLSLSYAFLGDAKTAYSRGTLTSVTEPCGRRCRFFFLQRKLWPRQRSGIHFRHLNTFSQLTSNSSIRRFILTSSGRDSPYGYHNTVDKNKFDFQVGKASWRIIQKQRARVLGFDYG